VLKTNLAGALSNPNANLTVFAPTDAAFAQLPAPFNNAANIAAINNAGQIDFLRNVLLYHVLGAEVFSYQVAVGRSSAATIKPAGSSNDNTIYFSKTFNLIRVNGQSDVILANINASNGVIHVINKVLLFPTNNIAEIAIGNPAFSSLVAALVKTNLAAVFTGNGDFTVFAPTDAAFAQLPAPFNNAANISAINNPAQITALANILKYHVIGERYFSWDLGILKRITTLADAPNNRITTILGYNTGWVKGIQNNAFAEINPGDLLATNGVIHVIDRVLLP
jgi:transforming growth factor-beta-induced protein